MITAMPNSRSRFKAVLGAGWVLLGLAAFLYARMKGIPGGTALPVAAAFLIEFPFYLWAGFDAPREWLAARSKSQAASLLTVSAVLPWLVYTIPTGEFTPLALAVLLIIATAVSFWYVAWPAGALADAAFLIVPVAAVIANVFHLLYRSPIAKVDVSILGHIMIIRTAALALLTIRGHAGVEFRFLPNRREWLGGARYFVMLLPVTGLVYWALGLVRLRPHPLNAGLAAATFLGILWVVALSEEFFFRGLLLPWLAKWTRSETGALIITSVLFGAVHLGFQHKWPNWRFATVAAVAGFFYGLAWRTTRSIQTSMVTHALTVTFWRVFLQ